MNYYDLAEACEVANIRRDFGIGADPMDEATYYGRNAELVKCEGYIQNIINIMRETRGAGWMSLEVANNFRDIEKSFEKLFGFDSVYINDSSMMVFSMRKAHMNAMTVVKGKMFQTTRVTMQEGEIAEVVKIDNKHSATRLKNGKGWNMRIIISNTIFCDYGNEYTMTAREILAILLHEVGHNFYGDVGKLTLSSLFDIFYVLFSSELWLIIKVMIIGIDFVKVDLVNAIFDAIDTVPGMREASWTIITVFQQIFGSVEQILSPIKNITNFFKLMALISSGIFIYNAKAVKKLLDPKNWFRGVINYDQEKYADAFAAAYGYGADQASALVKMESEQYLFPTEQEFIPVMQFIASTMFLFGKIAILPFLMMDQHPSNTARLKNMITYMEQVDSKKLPPELRREYLAELKRIQNTRVDAKNYQGYDVNKHMNKISAMFEDLIHLSDPRDLISTIGRWDQKYENLDFD